MNAPQKRKFNFGIALLIFGSTVVVVISILLAYLGFFRKMESSEVVREATPIIYREHKGAYHKINEDITEVEKWASSESLPCKYTFGEYLDDPNIVEEARLRSNAGCILDTSVPLNVPTKRPTQMQVGAIPAGAYLQVVFEGSPAIGPYKIYPFANGYFKEKGWGKPSRSYEIYEILSSEDMRTTYLFPIP